MSIISVFPGRGKPKLQNKSVSPSTSIEHVQADSGYDGLSQVSIEAIQTQRKSVNPSTSAQSVTPDSGKFLTKVTVGAAPLQSKSATPTTSAQTIKPDSGQYGLSQVSIEAIPVSAGRSSNGGSFIRRFYYGLSGEPSYIAGHCDGGINFDSGFVLYIVDFVIYDGKMHYTAYDIVDNRIYYGVFDSNYKLTVDEQGYLSVSITEDMIVAPNETVTGIIREGGTIAFPIAYFRYIIL